MACRAKGMEYDQLAGALERGRTPECGSEFRALQTLRALALAALRNSAFFALNENHAMLGRLK
jgi:hypothetical protein